MDLFEAAGAGKAKGRIFAKHCMTHAEIYWQTSAWFDQRPLNSRRRTVCALIFADFILSLTALGQLYTRLFGTKVTAAPIRIVT
jgi:hypothetical protein